jgi:uncharacterized repeat protein (TIGR01451 family)
VRTSYQAFNALAIAVWYGCLILRILVPASVSGAQISLSQFSSTNPVITFETASPFLPNVPGLQFTGGDALPGTGTNCFGDQYFGNRNGNTFLDVYFDQPQQAVGAYIIEASPLFGMTGVMEVAYDQIGNVIETASGSFPPWPSSPAFVGIGETNARIYRVEWRYLGAAGTFGVDNLIYGTASGVYQIPSIPSGVTASHQDLRVTLNWLPSDGASSYNVKRYNYGGLYSNQVTEVTLPSYTDTVPENGVYSYGVSALNASGESADSEPVTVYVFDRFSFTPIAPGQKSGVPFQLTISALDSNNFQVLNFNGQALLSGAGDHGNVSLQPSVLQFINGQWTGVVTVASGYPDTNIRLTCSSNGVTGSSNPFDAVATSFQEFDFYAADLLYDSKAQRIYATVPAASTNFANRLVVINPTVGRIETNYFLGDDPQKMALSDDGQFLYVTFYGSNVVRRFDMSTRSIGLQVPLGYDPVGNKIVAVHVGVLPGQPHSYAVAAGGLRIFDDAVERTNSLPVQGPIICVSPSRVYAGPPFTRVTLDSSGVVSSDSHDGYMGYYDDLKYNGGLVFSSSGEVFDPESLGIRGFLPACSIVEPDLSTGRIFTLTPHPNGALPSAWTLFGCDPITLQAISSVSLDPIAGGGPTSLIRWGTDGFAVAMSQVFPSWNQVFLIRTSLVPSQPPADVSVKVSNPTTLITLHSNLTFSILVTNQGPNNALTSSFLDLLPQNVTLVSASSTLGPCIVSNGIVTCDFGDLTNGTGGTVTLVVSPTAITQLTNVAVVSSGSFDPNMANNNAVTVVTCKNQPFAATQQPWIQTPSSVTLNGMAVPNGLDSTAWFEWGRRGKFDMVTPGANLDSGSATISFNAMLTNLTFGAVYQCRLVVSNALGMTFGATQLFSTGRRIVAWGDNSGGQLNIPTGLSNVVSLAAGRFHSVGLLTDGTVAAWGSNTYGQLAVPVGLSNVVAIAAGDSDCLALKSDGTVVGWGQNFAGQANIPAGISGIIAISQGVGHNLALKSDGTVAAWGDNEAQQCSVPAGLSNVVAVAAGYMHSEALKADGTVVCWGDVRQTDVPTNLTDVVAITAGSGFGAALRADGTVIQWPGGVMSNLTNEVTISANYASLLALETRGAVDFGAPAGLSNTCILAAGVMHAVADGDNLPPTAQSLLLSSVSNQDLVITLHGSDLNADPLSYRISSLPSVGVLYQCTNGVRGSVIDAPNEVVEDSQHRVIFTAQGVTRPPDQFVYVVNDGELDSHPATVSVNVGSTLASTQPATQIAPTRATLNGMALPNGMESVAWFEWGVPGQRTNVSSPQAVGSGGTVVRVGQPITGLVQPAVYQFRLIMSNAMGISYGAPARFTTGEKVAVWGSSSFGLDTVTRNLGLVVGVAAGYNHDLVVQSGGTVMVWGDNSNQQTNVPAGLVGICAVAGGNGQSLALTSGGTVIAWGRNDYGQATVPPGLSNVIAITAGAEHSVALLADGTVTGWGKNDYGQASAPASLSNTVAIAAGNDYSVGLQADGTIAVWGKAPPVPAGLTNVVAIAAGDSHVMALKLDGSVSAWGSNSQGQTNVPASAMSNVFGIGRGVDHSLAMTTDGEVVVWGNNDYGQSLAPTGLNHVVAVSGSEHNTMSLGGNVPPQPVTQNVTGLENQDLVIQCKSIDPNGDLLITRISSLPAVGSLYQYSGGARGAAILYVNTPISDSEGRVVFTSSANGFGIPYASFSFVSNDGQVDSKAGTIVVNIVAGNVPVLNVVRQTGSTPFTFMASGDSNGTYGVWASTNLLDWSLLGPLTPLSNGWFFFSDVATNRPYRFYKAKSQ